jgi:hypothetical protein
LALRKRYENDALTIVAKTTRNAPVIVEAPNKMVVTACKPPIGKIEKVGCVE